MVKYYQMRKHGVAMAFLHRCWFFLCYFLKRFLQDGCVYRASALTFTSLLAMVPLMVVAFSIFAAFPAFKTVGQQVQGFIFDNFVPHASQIVQTQVLTFVDKASQLSAVGFVFLIVTAVLMLFTIEQALNAIWRVPKRRKGVSAFLLYWAILTLSPILLGASVVISTYLLSLPLFAEAANAYAMQNTLLGILPFILTTIAFTLLFVALPNCHVPIRYGFTGAVFAAILFGMAKVGFAAYISNFNTYALLYGALAAIPIFLLWVYLSWLIILAGAELSYALTFRHSIRPGRQLDGFTHAFRWIGYLWCAQAESRTLSLRELVNRDKVNYQVPAEELITVLCKANLIRRTSANKCVLACDLSSMSLGDFHRRLPWKLPPSKDLHDANPWEHQLKVLLTDNEKKLTENLGVPIREFFR